MKNYLAGCVKLTKLAIKNLSGRLSSSGFEFRTLSSSGVSLRPAFADVIFSLIIDLGFVQ